MSQKTYRKIDRRNLTPPKPRPGIDHAQPIGPEKPSSTERFASNHPWLAKAATAVKERSAGVARELQKPNSFQGTPRREGRTPASPDPFGTMHMPNLFGGNPMSGREPRERSNSKGGRGTTRTIYHPDGSVEVIHSSRGRRRRKEPQERQEHTPNSFADPFHIPKSLRHMF